MSRTREVLVGIFICIVVLWILCPCNDIICDIGHNMKKQTANNITHNNTEQIISSTTGGNENTTNLLSTCHNFPLERLF